jgi:dTDP-4-dehydrorhamnose reductase
VDGERVLITGAAGLLGTWLRRTAPAHIAVLPMTHRTRVAGDDGLRADLRDADAVADVFARALPDLVIHTAYAHDEHSIADATQHVARAARAAGAAMIHVSSDVVFSGDGSPRAEEAALDPVSDYGRWKARAEQVVQRTAPGAAVVRLPLVVSLEPEDHVIAQIRAGGPRGGPTVWFDDEYRQPAYAEEIARAFWRIVALDAASRSGRWHLPGPERLTRAETARRVVRALGLDENVVAFAPTPAGLARPRDLHLLDDRARGTIGWNPTPVLGP